MDILELRFNELLKQWQSIEICSDDGLQEISSEAAAKACASITLEEMGRFAEWVAKKEWYLDNGDLGTNDWFKYRCLDFLTTEQLIQEYFKKK